MTYLVTGGAGFIGRHVAEALLTRGDRAVIIDNFNEYYDPAIKRRNAERLRHYDNCVIIEGDIRDQTLVDRLFAEHGISHVAHLAAMAGVRESIQQARLYVDVNVTGTLNLLEASKTAEIQQFVLASTSSVYGKTEILPFVETDSADRPLAAYPASKRAAELLAHTYHNLVDMPVTALRFFNVYGPAGRPDMMPWRLMEATQTGEEIQLFNGGDIHRDWTYIADTVRGVVAALDLRLGFEIINLGCGAPISLKDFVDIIEGYAGKGINTVSVPTPQSDPPITYCDNSKARELLGFAPSVTVREGLRQTWDWYREYRRL
ncbi:MAG: SDR family NAD(P)-dependent oxidoreductase [Chloroflexi bacterium]|nr:SDR family NAD(P)-dependent oxidoreductase [Chloroflexota bacterium]MCY3867191.1 SDR family NAD(P)-dependent oxidoreductase [Chloroflexota bacterium]